MFNLIVITIYNR